MRKWKTNKGRMNTSPELRGDFLKFLSQLPAKSCNECVCGRCEAVINDDIVYCRDCGRVRSSEALAVKKYGGEE